MFGCVGCEGRQHEKDVMINGLRSGPSGGRSARTPFCVHTPSQFWCSKSIGFAQSKLAGVGA